MAVLSRLGLVVALCWPAVAFAQDGPAAPIIREIHFVQTPIFSQEDKDSVPIVPLGVANSLHVDTQDYVIRRELLFTEGDTVDRDVLDESERKLRQTGFLVDVKIETQPVDDDTVDVYVYTREVWTTTFDFQYEKFQNTTLFSLRLSEKNFLGTGRKMMVERREELDRTLWNLGASDPHLLGSNWRGEFQIVNSSDGGATVWSLQRPFFSLSDTWSTGATYARGGASPRYYLRGQSGLYVRPHGDVFNVNFDYAHKLWTHEYGVTRIGVGIFVNDQRFTTGPDFQVYDSYGTLDGLRVPLPPVLPEDRATRGPYLALTKTTSRYGQRRYLDRMGRNEDIGLGHEIFLSGGYITTAMGSDFDGFRFRAYDKWAEIRGPWTFRSDIETSGILRNGRSVDVHAELQVWAHRFLPASLSFASTVVAATGSNLDRHRVYALGIDTGLRSAVPLEFPGDRLLRSNVELRYVYKPGLLSLVTPGLALFADVGTAWFERERDLAWSDFRGAVGAGLRLGMNHASLNAPIRVDFAWPVLYSTNRAVPVISIAVAQVF